MKFKILEVNDFDYDEKDKNMITYRKWLELRKAVSKNPKRITFNPLEVELQRCYEVWLSDRRIWFFERVWFPLMIISFIGAIIWGIMTGEIR